MVTRQIRLTKLRYTESLHTKLVQQCNAAINQIGTGICYKIAPVGYFSHCGNKKKIPSASYIAILLYFRAGKKST